ncbi:MAG TPA: hypothetical protein VHS09_00685 [Polyangiaceae bacterium]|jgi:hypothetical protein|nr:hypothetical protein [Polyangiaceae bacterium]
MLPRTLVLSVASLAILAAAACSSGSPQCHVGADCASGACNASGQCVPAPEAGADSGGGGVEAGVEAAAEAGVEASPGDDASTGCIPNDDGTVTRAELPMLAGLHASFAITTATQTMGTAGTAQPDGSTDWDFSAALSGDQTVVITTNAPAGQWFAAQFTSATYTTTLSETEPFLGVYQATAASLLLQGVVAPTNAAPVTELSYSPSAEILAVPLQMGTTWTSTSTVTGKADGIASDYTEKYDSVVDAHGTLKVPYGTFQVLRVQTTLTRTIVPVTDVETTQVMTFIAECFGPVAKLTSKTTTAPQAVPGNAFTSVAEAWRLSP